MVSIVECLARANDIHGQSKIEFDCFEAQTMNCQFCDRLYTLYDYPDQRYLGVAILECKSCTNFQKKLQKKVTLKTFYESEVFLQDPPSFSNRKLPTHVSKKNTHKESEKKKKQISKLRLKRGQNE